MGSLQRKEKGKKRKMLNKSLAMVARVPKRTRNVVQTQVRSISSTDAKGFHGMLPGIDEAAQFGNLSLRLGLGWSKSQSFHTGQCPVMKYHHKLMQAILYDKIKIADAVNVEVISLDDAPRGYEEFDTGAAK